MTEKELSNDVYKLVSVKPNINIDLFFIRANIVHYIKAKQLCDFLAILVLFLLILPSPVITCVYVGQAHNYGPFRFFFCFIFGLVIHSCSLLRFYLYSVDVFLFAMQIQFFFIFWYY
jgi:hypothetical protein